MDLNRSERLDRVTRSGNGYHSLISDQLSGYEFKDQGRWFSDSRSNLAAQSLATIRSLVSKRKLGRSVTREIRFPHRSRVRGKAVARSVAHSSKLILPAINGVFAVEPRQRMTG